MSTSNRIGQSVQIDVEVDEVASPISLRAQRVVDIVEEAMAAFLEKNAGYGDTGYVLGARGQYADMNRKMGKLKHTLWDGNPAVGEPVREMLMDLIGHCALAIDYLDIEKEGTW